LACNSLPKKMVSTMPGKHSWFHTLMSHTPGCRTHYGKGVFQAPLPSVSRRTIVKSMFSSHGEHSWEGIYMSFFEKAYRLSQGRTERCSLGCPGPVPKRVLGYPRPRPIPNLRVPAANRAAVVMCGRKWPRSVVKRSASGLSQLGRCAVQSERGGFIHS